MFTIFIKEVSSYFNSLVGYMVIAIYLILTSLLLWLFPDTSLLDSGYADLSIFFEISPYLLLFLIPALTMRLLSGEFADGTFDLLRSRPLSIYEIVIGKYFAALFLSICAILPTIVYAISIYYLAYPVGNIDIGATIGSYVGLFLLSITYCAIGIFSSSLTKNPIVSFLISLFICFAFYDGFGAIAGISNFSDYEYFIANLGIREHYASVSRGVLSFRDLIYFLSVVFLFITLTVGHTDRKFRPRKVTFTAYACVFLLIALLNTQWFTGLLDRIDFTSDKRYSLSSSTKSVLQKMEQDIYITLFLDGKLPNDFERLKKATVDIIRDMHSYAGSNIFLNVIDPFDPEFNQNDELTQALIHRGLTPTNLSVRNETGLTQRLLFPGAIIATDDMEIPINLLQDKTGISHQEVLNNSIQNLEYSILSGIQKVLREKLPIIAFTEGHGEPSDLELYDAIHSLAISNQVGRVHLDSISLTDMDKLDLLVIAKPKRPFSEAEKYKIDYYVRNGGNIIWALDQTDAGMDHLRTDGQQLISGQQLNLDDLLFMYGVRINYDLIADMNCASIPINVGRVGAQAQIELLPWYFSPVLTSISSHPLVKNLDGIRTDFISTIDTLESSHINKEIILRSSPFSKKLNSGQFVSLDIIEEIPDPEKMRGEPYITGVLMEGRFPPIFAGRPIPEGIYDNPDTPIETQAAKMLVISDGDWLINQVSSQDSSAYPLGWDKYTNKQFANKVFLQNAVDYFLNDASLIALRNREIKLLLLDKAKVKDEKTKWKIINIICPLLLLFIAGSLQHIYRKLKYGKKKAY